MRIAAWVSRMMAVAAEKRKKKWNVFDSRAAKARQKNEEN